MINTFDFNNNLVSLRMASESVIDHIRRGLAPSAIADEASRVSNLSGGFELLTANAASFALKHGVPAAPELDALAKAAAAIANEARGLIVGKPIPSNPEGYQALLEAIAAARALWDETARKLEV